MTRIRCADLTAGSCDTTVAGDAAEREVLLGCLAHALAHADRHHRHDAIARDAVLPDVCDGRPQLAASALS